MKTLFFSILTLLFFSCTKEIIVPVIKIQHDTTIVVKIQHDTTKIYPEINPEIDILNNAFVGVWNLGDFGIGDDNNRMHNYSALMPNLCDTLQKANTSHNIVKSYKVSYKNDTLHVTKTYWCNNKVEELLWFIVLVENDPMTSNVHYTEHPFQILEKNLNGNIMVSYRIQYFNLTSSKFPSYSPINFSIAYVLYDNTEHGLPKPYYMQFKKE